MAGAYRTPSLRRGGQAGPVHALSALFAPAPILAMTYHSDHFIQHLCRAANVCPEVALTDCCRCTLSAAKTFSFRARYAIHRPTQRPEGLGAASYLRAPKSATHPTNLSAFLLPPPPPPPQPQTRNGCEVLCCARCAPIDVCCCEETCAVCLPERAAAGAKAAAILGICRVYVEA